MKRSPRIRSILLAAVAATPLAIAGRARAQVPVNQSGAALDASTRVGSYGHNLGGVTPLTNQIYNRGNLVVTGNVTGGKGFRGGVPYTNQLEFRGNVAGSGIDQFIASSSGIPAANRPTPVPGASVPFYGSASLAGPAPAGYEPRGFTGIYTPTPQPQQPRLPGQLAPMGGALDVAPMISRPGDTIVPGPLDAEIQSYMTASPLLGVRTWSLPDLAAQPGFLADTTSLTRLRLDPGAILRMRNELSAAAADASIAGDGTSVPGVSPNIAQPMPTPFDAPTATALTANPLATNLTAKPLTGDLGQSQRERLVSPAQQSSQYAEMQNRLSRYYKDRPQTDEEAHRQFTKQYRAQQAPEAQGNLPGRRPEEPTPTPEPLPGQPGGAPGALPGQPGIGPGALPGQPEAAPGLLPGQPAAPLPPLAGAGPAPAPVQVPSLAQGIKAQGLANLMIQAERLMQQGKFLSALDQYQAAEQVAPNNPLIQLGKVHAELGAGAYQKAETHLRQALTGDEALTMAQYDLKTMIGAQSLETLVKDLKETATRQADDPGPLILLAYVAYNTNNERQAATYLELANQRAGGQEPLYKLLKTHWRLPAATPSTAPTNPPTNPPTTQPRPQ